MADALPSVEDIDRMGLNAFPAFVQEERDEMVFRAAGGFNYRNSSVTLFDPASVSAARILPEIVAFSDANSIRPVLRVIGDPGPLGDDLRARGWAPFRECIVMIRTGDGDDVGNLPEGLRECALTAWLDVQVQHKALEERDAKTFRDIFSNLPDSVRLVALDDDDDDDDVSATALLYAQGEWLGLMNMLVDPALRGKGIGRRLLILLLDIPARGMWLQVYSGNETAIRLYDSVGFKAYYRYDYWAESET